MKKVKLLRSMNQGEVDKFLDELGVLIENNIPKDTGFVLLIIPTCNHDPEQRHQPATVLSISDIDKRDMPMVLGDVKREMEERIKMGLADIDSE
jgi:hypothetical protein